MLALATDRVILSAPAIASRDGLVNASACNAVSAWFILSLSGITRSFTRIFKCLGPECNIACPGGEAAECSGHGRCELSSLNTSRCVCESALSGFIEEYRGEMCEIASYNTATRVRAQVQSADTNKPLDGNKGQIGGQFWPTILVILMTSGEFMRKIGSTSLEQVEHLLLRGWWAYRCTQYGIGRMIVLYDNKYILEIGNPPFSLIPNCSPIGQCIVLGSKCTCQRT